MIDTQGPPTFIGCILDLWPILMWFPIVFLQGYAIGYEKAKEEYNKELKEIIKENK